ncbi:unnamed protein product, partial [Ectocarpus sp. 4 AP-2014]
HLQRQDNTAAGLNKKLPGVKVLPEDQRRIIVAQPMKTVLKSVKKDPDMWKRYEENQGELQTVLLAQNIAELVQEP